MSQNAAFVCPTCSFRVFNRRYSKCEKCGAALPTGLVYSPEQVQALRAQDEAEEEKRRAARRKEEQNNGGGYGGDAGLGYGSADGGGGGGD